MGETMATITIKNIPDDLYEQLKETAAANRRSINSEVIHLIEQAVSGRQLDPEAFIARARLLRERTAGYQLTGEVLRESRTEGRP